MDNNQNNFVSQGNCHVFPMCSSLYIDFKKKNPCHSLYNPNGVEFKYSPCELLFQCIRDSSLHLICKKEASGYSLPCRLQVDKAKRRILLDLNRKLCQIANERMDEKKGFTAISKGLFDIATELAKLFTKEGGSEKVTRCEFIDRLFFYKGKAVFPCFSLSKKTESNDKTTSTDIDDSNLVKDESAKQILKEMVICMANYLKVVTLGQKTHLDSIWPNGMTCELYQVSSHLKKQQEMPSLLPKLIPLNVKNDSINVFDSPIIVSIAVSEKNKPDELFKIVIKDLLGFVQRDLDNVNFGKQGEEWPKLLAFNRFKGEGVKSTLCIFQFETVEKTDFRKNDFTLVLIPFRDLTNKSTVDEIEDMKKIPIPHSDYHPVFYIPVYKSYKELTEYKEQKHRNNTTYKRYEEPVSLGSQTGNSYVTINDWLNRNQAKYELAINETSFLRILKEQQSIRNDILIPPIYTEGDFPYFMTCHGFHAYVESGSEESLKKIFSLNSFFSGLTNGSHDVRRPCYFVSSPQKLYQPSTSKTTRASNAASLLSLMLAWYVFHFHTTKWTDEIKKEAQKIKRKLNSIMKKTEDSPVELIEDITLYKFNQMKKYIKKRVDMLNIKYDKQNKQYMTNLDIKQLQGTSDDVAGIIALLKGMGFKLPKKDIQNWVQKSGKHLLGAYHNEKLAGVVATYPYPDGHFAYVNDVIVLFDWRYLGITKKLLGQLSLVSCDYHVLRLCVPDIGRHIYERMGFVPFATLCFVELPPKASGGEACNVKDIEPMSDKDLHDAYFLDYKHFGAFRKDAIRTLLENAPTEAWVLRRNGCLDGFIVRAPKNWFMQSRNAETFTALLEYAHSQNDSIPFLVYDDLLPLFPRPMTVHDRMTLMQYGIGLPYPQTTFSSFLL